MARLVEDLEHVPRNGCGAEVGIDARLLHGDLAGARVGRSTGVGIVDEAWALVDDGGFLKSPEVAPLG